MQTFDLDRYIYGMSVHLPQWAIGVKYLKQLEKILKLHIEKQFSIYLDNIKQFAQLLNLKINKERKNNNASR